MHRMIDATHLFMSCLFGTVPQGPLPRTQPHPERLAKLLGVGESGTSLDRLKMIPEIPIDHEAEVLFHISRP